MKPDAVVIGGGPAGTSAAIRLARQGQKVQLYEKSHFPRTKLCGGFLSAEGLLELADLNVLDPLRRSGVISLHRSVIASSRGTVVETGLSDEALSISRDTFDDLLMQEARRSGVQVFEGVDGLPQGGLAASTIFANGRREISPPVPRGRTIYFGIQALFKDVHDVTDQVELDLVDSGYVGLARQRQGINVCALTTKETIDRYGPSLDRVLNHFTRENPVLQAHLKDATRHGPWQATGPVRMGIRQLAHDRTFYVGDAACVVDPFTGEGMSNGLYSSRLLARALAQTERSAADAYSALWKEAFLPALRWNTAMRVLSSLSLFREPLLKALEQFPRGMNWLTDLTRYRRVLPIEQQ